MMTLKKLAMGLVLALILALTCGAAVAKELVIVANDEIMELEGVKAWLGDLAELGVTIKMVTEADFEAVKASPLLAVFIVHDPGYNLDLFPIVITSATQRMGLETPGTRKLFIFDNKLAQDQVLFVFSTARTGGLGLGDSNVFNENRPEWMERLAN